MLFDLSGCAYLSEIKPSRERLCNAVDRLIKQELFAEKIQIYGMVLEAEVHNGTRVHFFPPILLKIFIQRNKMLT